MKELKKRFKAFLTEERRVKPDTVKCYLCDIDLLEKRMDELDFKLDDLDAENFELIVNGLEHEGRSAASIERFLSSVRMFCRFLTFEGVFNRSISFYTEVGPKEKDESAQILTEREISMLLAQPDVTTFKGLRDRVMLELCYASALRISELLALNVADVNIFTATISSHTGKSVRYCQIYPTAAAVMGDYISGYSRYFGAAASAVTPLFTNRQMQRLTRQGLWKIIKEYADLAGLENVTPVVLRRSYAAHLAAKGAAPEDIMRTMNYRSLASAKAYANMMK